MSVRNIWVSLVNQVYGLLGLAHGGTNADLSGTGGASQVLKQVTAGAAVTVGQLAASDLSNGVTGTGAVVLANAPGFTAGINILSAPPQIIIGDGAGNNYSFSRNGATGFLNVSGTQIGYIGYTFNGVVGATGYQVGSTVGVTQTAGAPTSIATMGGIVTTLVVTSDERLKDFKPYEGGLDEVLAITPIRYKWNEKGIEIGADGSRGFIGFGAQDVQKVIPEAIVGQQVAKDGTSYLGFDDRPVIAALVNAIKELSAQITELKAAR